MGADTALKAMDSFSNHGGLLGLTVFDIIFISFGTFIFLVWFIKTSRVHENQIRIHHAEQYEKRLMSEQNLVKAIHELTLTIQRRPCMKVMDHINSGSNTDMVYKHP